MSLQAVSTTDGSDFKSLQAISMTDNSDFDTLQAFSTAGNSDVKSQQFVQIGSSNARCLQPVLTTRSSDFDGRKLRFQVPAIIFNNCPIGFDVSFVDDRANFSQVWAVCFQAEQGVSKIEQGAFMAEQGIAKCVVEGCDNLPSTISYLSSTCTAKSFDTIQKLRAVARCMTIHAPSRPCPFIPVNRQDITQFILTTSEQGVSKVGQGVPKLEMGVSMVVQAVSKTLVITTAELLTITKTTYTASITGDLFTAEKVLTRDITADAKNFASYANRSFIMARKFDWNNALQDATKSLAIQTSLPGYIAQGIAFCGKQLVDDARAAFDLAFTFTQGIWMLLRFVHFVHQASLRFELGTIALNGGHHSEAGTFLAKSPPPSSCEVFNVLFGWDIETLWQMSNQKLILALLGDGMLGEAFESYRLAMDASDETTKTNLQSCVLKCRTMILQCLHAPSLPAADDPTVESFGNLFVRQISFFLDT
ncbi:hypothetical protein BD769DRAFT_1395733 [Suillus cothurnatus]|nr:hypothetical protein BD769DRAFT_1395733 [Suillus cothurnatus]